MNISGTQNVEMVITDKEEQRIVCIVLKKIFNIKNTNFENGKVVNYGINEHNGDYYIESERIPTANEILFFKLIDKVNKYYNSVK
jgi:hypothetical protein